MGVIEQFAALAGLERASVLAYAALAGALTGWLVVGWLRARAQRRDQQGPAPARDRREGT
jgi:hypothetical protein